MASKFNDARGMGRGGRGWGGRRRISRKRINASTRERRGNANRVKKEGELTAHRVRFSLVACIIASACMVRTHAGRGTCRARTHPPLLVLPVLRPYLSPEYHRAPTSNITRFQNARIVRACSLRLCTSMKRGVRAGGGPCGWCARIRQQNSTISLLSHRGLVS